MFSKIDGRWGITSFGLKIIGILLMVVDHIHEMFYYVGAPTYLTMFGRVVAPIFLFLAAEGYHYTRSKTKYLRNLLVGFWITNFVEYILSKWLPNPHIELINSIFGTLFLAVLAMWIYDGLLHPKTNKKSFIFSIVGLLFLIIPPLFLMFAMMPNNSQLLPFGMVIMEIVPNVITVEGGVIFILLALLFHIFREKKLVQMLALVIIGLLMIPLGADIQWIMIFAAPLIYLYNRDQGKKAKWLFYIFYPTHIAILYIIATMLFPK